MRFLAVYTSSVRQAIMIRVTCICNFSNLSALTLLQQSSTQYCKETLTLFQTKMSDFPYPISDLIKSLIPYFRPEALEPGAWSERVTSCYGTYTLVEVNIKREKVLSPNDEEVANSSRLEFKNHTLFRTKMVEIDTLFQTKTAKKPYLWRGTSLSNLTDQVFNMHIPR